MYKEKKKPKSLSWSATYYYSISWKQKFSSEWSRMEVFKNNWPASLCISELWLFAWWANKKLRVQRILMRLIQSQLLRPWHFSACEKLNWQEIEVWRVNKIDSTSQNFSVLTNLQFSKEECSVRKFTSMLWGRGGGRRGLLFPFCLQNQQARKMFSLHKQGLSHGELD